MELFGQTYELADEHLFNIPEEAQYPIFNEDNAKLIFDENQCELPEGRQSAIFG
jgi:hypothetical protein